MESAEELSVSFSRKIVMQPNEPIWMGASEPYRGQSIMNSRGVQNLLPQEVHDKILKKYDYGNEPKDLPVFKISLFTKQPSHLQTPKLTRQYQNPIRPMP